ncbi:MAG TPA: 2Fe-2S iron-sulfur cluster binding domain-containing protein [Allocoleopsis sp.]
MTQTYSVTINHRGNTHTISVPDDTTILNAALAANINLPNSCNAGVCTTCAAKLISGSVTQTEGMGVSPDLQAKGYALLCVAYPSSDIKLETEKEEELYELQFGQYQKR